MKPLSEETIDLSQKLEISKWYESLVDQNQEGEYLTSIPTDLVLEILKEVGYTAEFNQKENFFVVESIQSNGKTELKLSLKHSALEIIIAVTRPDKNISIVGPFSFFVKRLGLTRQLPLPKITSTHQLKRLITSAILMYDGLKNEVDG